MLQIKNMLIFQIFEVLLKMFFSQVQDKTKIKLIAFICILIYLISPIKILGITSNTIEIEKTEPSSEFKQFIERVILDALKKKDIEVFEAYQMAASLPPPAKIKVKTEDYDIGYLDDNIYLLSLAMNQSVELKSQSFKKAIKISDDVVSKSQAYQFYLADELIKVRDLSRIKAWNSIAGVFNTISKTFSQIITGNIHAILSVFLEAGFSIYHIGDFTEKDGLRLYLYSSYQKKFPDSPANQQIERKIQQLKKSKSKQILKEYLKRAKKDCEDGQYHLADFFILKAESLKLDYYKKKLESLKLKIARQDSSLKRERTTSLNFIQPTLEKTMNPSEQKKYKEIMDALLSEKKDAIEKIADEFTEEFPLNEIVPEVEFAKVVALQLNGDDELSKFKLARLSRKKIVSSTTEREKSHLKNPYFNPPEEFKVEKKKFLNSTAIYCLTGFRSTEERVKITLSALINSPQMFAQTLGSLFIIEIILRTSLLPLNNPVSDQALVDSAQKTLKKGKDNSIEMLKLLVKRYKKRGEFEKALKCAKLLNDFTSKTENKLRKKWAKAEYVLADQMKTPQKKIKHLKKILEIYPDSKIAKKAGDEIIKLENIKDVFLWIDKKNLQRFPELLEQNLLNIQLILIDGKKKNGEMDDSGVGLKKDNTIVFYNLKTKSYQTQKIDIEDERQPEFWGIVYNLKKEKDLEWALEEKTTKRYFPFEIEGSAGSSGVSVYPLMQRLD